MTMLVLVTALSLSSVLMENQPLCKDNSACVEGHSFFKFDIGGELQSMFKYYMVGGSYTVQVSIERSNSFLDLQ